MRSNRDLLHSRLALASLLIASATASACADEDADRAEGCNRPGVVCTYLGTGELGFNGDGRPLAETMLYWPIDMTFDPSGREYVVDWNNHRVREVTPDGTLETVIGTDFLGDGPDDKSDLTAEGAPGTEVLLNHPTQLLPMPDGRPLLFAWHNHKLRRFDPETGRVTIECGRAAGFAGDGGPAAMALLNQPVHGALNADGELFIVDQRNQVIRRIDVDGNIDTVAGIPTMAGFAGDGDSPLAAQLNQPAGSNPPPGGGIAVDADGVLYIADTLNHRIRKIDLEADVITTLAGTGEPGFSGDDGPADAAQLHNPRKLTIGPDGRLYVGDEKNDRIRAIDLETGVITTAAGTGERTFDGDGRAPEDTALHRPTGVVFDADDNMYILDTYNSRVRRVLAESAQGETP